MTRSRSALRRAMLLAACALAACGGPASDRRETAPSQAASDLRLTSKALTPGKSMPDDFTCAGADFSPPLAWNDPPSGTRGFMVVLEDRDAPGGTFYHWGAYNLAPDRRELEPGAGAEGADFPQAVNDFGRVGYSGPCPPRSEQPHEYRFRLFALDVDRLSGGPGGAMPKVRTMLDNARSHVLASTELSALFAR